MRIHGLIPRKLAKWNAAGILLTYWCNAECADCYENCGPRRRGILPTDEIRNYLRELKQLGCSGSRLHFAGGEPFYDYRHLIECLQVAGEEGMLPLGKLETNAFWCKNDELVRERLSEIERLGILKLAVSSDVFHQEFIPIERVQRVVRIGSEVLGKKRVEVNSSEFFRDPIDVRELPEEEKLEVFRDALRQRQWRIVGRASRSLSHLIEKHPKEAFAGNHCVRKILRRRSIHIDPHGNVFPSTCAGLTLGNASRQPLSSIFQTFAYREHPVVKTLVERGPVPLLEEAVARGFAPDEDGYATKCHMCFEARRFFWEQGLYADEVGPAELYAD